VNYIVKYALIKVIKRYNFLKYFPPNNIPFIIH